MGGLEGILTRIAFRVCFSYIIKFYSFSRDVCFFFIVRKEVYRGDEICIGVIELLGGRVNN